MNIKFLGGFIALFLMVSCDFIDCNYDKLTDAEYAKIAILNQNFEKVDTLYNDRCLKGFVHAYLKTDATNDSTDTEIQEIFMEFRKAQMKRDIWVFNNKKKFLYRMFHSHLSNNGVKTELQYPNE
jgi:formate-dependent nitrite reductase cytochrome c552 subunit